MSSQKGHVGTRCSVPLHTYCHPSHSSLTAICNTGLLAQLWLIHKVSRTGCVVTYILLRLLLFGSLTNSKEENQSQEENLVTVETDGPGRARRERINPLKVQVSPLCLCIQAPIWQNPAGFPPLLCLFTSIACTLRDHEVKDRGGIK